MIGKIWNIFEYDKLSRRTKQQKKNPKLHFKKYFSILSLYPKELKLFLSKYSESFLNHIYHILRHIPFYNILLNSPEIRCKKVGSTIRKILSAQFSFWLLYTYVSVNPGWRGGVRCASSVILRNNYFPIFH